MLADSNKCKLYYTLLGVLLFTILYTSSVNASVFVVGNASTQAVLTDYNTTNLTIANLGTAVNTGGTGGGCNGQCSVDKDYSTGDGWQPIGIPSLGAIGFHNWTIPLGINKSSLNWSANAYIPTSGGYVMDFLCVNRSSPGTLISLGSYTNSGKKNYTHIINPDCISNGLLTTGVSAKVGNLEYYEADFINGTYLNVSEDSQTWTNTTLSLSTETFLLNVSLDPSLTLSSAIMVYNNTVYYPLITGGGRFWLVNQTLIVPNVNVNTNISFYWNLSLSDGTNYSTVINNQTINPLTLDNCTSNNNKIFNISLYDEDAGTVLNGVISYDFVIYDSLGSTLLYNFSKINVSTPSGLCLNTNLTASNNYLLTGVINYNYNSSYANEFYNFLNFHINNNTVVNEVFLYDLLSSRSTDFQLTFTYDSLPIARALVYLDRQFIGSGYNYFKTIEVPALDTNGQTILHIVRNTNPYNLRVINASGSLIGSLNNFIAFCKDFAIGDCQINLNSLSSTNKIYNSNNTLGLISSPISYNNNTRIMSFSFVASDGTAKVVLMNITRSDVFGNRSICSNTLTAVSGSLTCQVPAGLSDAQLRGNVYVNGELVSNQIIDLLPGNYGSAGYLVFLALALSFILMFSGSKEGVLFAIVISFAGGIGLSLISGDLVGFGASGLWIIVIVVIALWKLNKDRPS